MQDTVLGSLLRQSFFDIHANSLQFQRGDEDSHRGWRRPVWIIVSGEAGFEMKRGRKRTTPIRCMNLNIYIPSRQHWQIPSERFEELL